MPPSNKCRTIGGAECNKRHPRINAVADLHVCEVCRTTWALCICTQSWKQKDSDEAALISSWWKTCRQSESSSSSSSPSICIPRRHLLHHGPRPVCIALSQSDADGTCRILPVVSCCFVCFSIDFCKRHTFSPACRHGELARDAGYVARAYFPK